MSIFALGFMVSFANNGQKELELEKFNIVTPENQSTVVEFQEFSASSIATYELVVWIYNPDSCRIEVRETLIEECE
ncbi:MAG: hypothetical protein WCY06_09350 [Flavobacteriaceae bacterium]